MPKKIQIRPPGLKPTTKVGTLGTLPRTARPRVGHRAAHGRGLHHRRRLLRALPLMLQAYCWPQSVAPGEPAGLHVSSDTGSVRRRGRARGGRTRGRVALATGGDRRSRDPCRRGIRWLQLARGDRDPGWTLAIRLLLRDPHGGQRARRRLPGGSAGARCGARADPARALHLHLERVQRLGRAVALHRRHPRVVRTPVGARVLRQARAGAAQDAAGDRSRGPLVLRMGRTTRAVGLERRRRLVELGATVRPVGRAAGVRRRRRDQSGPRGTPRRARGPPVVRQRGARRVLVVGHARGPRRVHRRAAATR